jgi:GNAT superfamily N-acetyltransferase
MITSSGQAWREAWMSSDVRVRPAEPADEARWRELFDAYTRFYEREPDLEISRQTWSRIQSPGSPVYAIVAEHDGAVVGIANYLLHENTSSLHQACYLQDLFVDPAIRGRGIGKALIDWLWAETQAQGWGVLYWQTRENNYRARTLYDTYTPHSGFLRYLLRNPG